MNDAQIEEYGAELYRALRTATAVEPLTDRTPSITIDEAYRIQSALNRLRVERDGERVIGKKIGVTSKAVQDMLGVHQPDFGLLLDTMKLPDGSMLSLSQLGLIQPRAEGEIAFVLRDALQGPGVTAEQVLDATAYVSPCFEIVDSRIRDWKIAIEDTVADNASCGVFVLGADRAPPRAHDLAAVRMEIRKNGALAATGLGSAVQGHPAVAVAWLANTLGAFDIPFEAGEVILSGSLAPLLPAAAGDRFDLVLDGLGSASIAFTR